MKKLLLILLLFITFISYGQTDSTQYVTNSNVEKLVDKYSEKVEAAFVALADKLQQPVEYVYKLVVKQQYIKGISSILFLIVSIIIFYLGYKQGEKENWEDGPWVLPLCLGGLAIISAIAWFFASGLACLLNPEYMAIKEIIKMF